MLSFELLNEVSEWPVIKRDFIGAHLGLLGGFLAHYFDMLDESTDLVDEILDSLAIRSVIALMFALGLPARAFLFFFDVIAVDWAKSF